MPALNSLLTSPCRQRVLRNASLAGRHHLGLLQNDRRLQALDKRIDGVDQRLGRMETRLDSVDTKLAGVSERLVKVETKLGSGHVVLSRT
jgi:archaellum component FlaC